MLFTQEPHLRKIEESQPLNAIQEKRYWEKIILSQGGSNAYTQFKIEYQNQSPVRQHLGAHIFGETLYEQVGLDGITICDETFTFGCYHSFFAKALGENGPLVIKAMDQACVEKFGADGSACQHGIGHGLMEYYGHDNLKSALEKCLETTQPHELFGCTGGVFMEYNVPMTLSNNYLSTTPRQVDGKNPSSPCQSLDDKFKQSCYYELGQWWDKVYKSDISKIGSLCQSTPIEFQSSCFLGIGNFVGPSSNFDAEISRQLCEKLPTKESQFMCKIRASWTFVDSQNASNGYQVCADTPPEIQSQCLKSN